MPCLAAALDARQVTGLITGCREAGVLARILHEQRGVLNHSNVSAAWVCMARIGNRGRDGGEVREVVAAIQNETRGVLNQMDGRQIANTIHSIARLHLRGVRADPELLAAIQRRAAATSGGFKPQDVANVLWALETMGETADRGLLEACMLRNLPPPMVQLPSIFLH
ncbi:hypothetical protein T484DRAFT_1795995 [Baffinella frigidus]|nr:hypothetical protein T484DRAFT_1795995 [Cryptophyta sp. CCMP2293]